MIDLLPRLAPVEAVAESAGRTVAGSPDDLVEGTTARRHERLSIDMEDGRQAVRAESGVLAQAPVVVDRRLKAGIGISAIGAPRRFFVAREADAGVGSVATRLDC